MLPAGTAASTPRSLTHNTIGDAFERLVFNILQDAAGYESRAGSRWLMKTRGPDRGRDLSVDRVVADSVSGTRRERVIVQRKH